MSTYRRPVWICGRAGAGRWRRRGDGRASRSAAPYASDACAGCEVGAVSVRFAVYSVSTCMDEDSGAHHRGRQRRVSSAERTRTASALIPFRASWLKAGRGKRGRFSRPWRRPSVIGANEAGGSRRCASVNQGGTARAFSRPWAGSSQAIGEEGSFLLAASGGHRQMWKGSDTWQSWTSCRRCARARWPPSNRLRTLPRSRRCAWRCWARPAR